MRNLNHSESGSRNSFGWTSRCELALTLASLYFPVGPALALEAVPGCSHTSNAFLSFLNPQSCSLSTPFHPPNPSRGGNWSPMGHVCLWPEFPALWREARAARHWGSSPHQGSQPGWGLGLLLFFFLIEIKPTILTTLKYTLQWFLTIFTML